MKVIAIAAVNLLGYIGLNNELMYSLPEDLKRFKELTTDATVIMGRKTFQSIGRVLPNRTNVVLTKCMETAAALRIEHPKLIVFTNPVEAMTYLEAACELYGNKDVYVIGGSHIYERLMSFVEQLEITEVIDSAVGDTRFPTITPYEWKLLSSSVVKHSGVGTKFRYLTYVRRK